MRLANLVGTSAAMLTLGLGAAAYAQVAPTADPYLPPPPQQPYQPQPGQPYPTAQPYQPGQPAQPGQPYPTAQPYQPGQPYQPQPGQPYEAQPGYGYPAQPGYYPAMPQRQIVSYRMAPRYGLVIGGAVLLGVSWLITVGSTAVAQSTCNFTTDGFYDSYSYACPNTYWPAYIPVLGPFIEMAYVPIDGSQGLARFGLAVSGLAQMGGLTMLVVGMVARHRVPVYAQKVQVAPLLTAGGRGLAFSGRF